MKKTFVFLAVLLSVMAQAAPPYDVSVTFSLVAGADSYLFFIDDCAGAPIGAGTPVTPGQTFPAILTADGTYLMCVRAENATGIQPDPGQVVTVVVNDLPLPGPINDLDIQVQCPNGGCTVNVTVN